MARDIEAQFEHLTSRAAMLSSKWAEVELVTVILFSEVVGCEFHLASAILNTITANKVRRELIANCARLAYEDEAILKRLEKLLSRVAKAVRLRNTLAHATFGIHPEHPRSLMVMGQTPGWHQYDIVRESDFDRFERQFTELREDLGTFLAELQKAERAELIDSRHAQRLSDRKGE